MIPVDQVTILFVDDEPDILNALKRFLKREEYISEFVNSGMEAVERLKKGDIDIVVTDMQMPQMDGNEVVQHLKENYPSVVRIVLSANTNFEQTMTSLNSGEIFRYILKPLNPKLFRAIMHDAVDYYRMRRLCEQVLAEGEPGQMPGLEHAPVEQHVPPTAAAPEAGPEERPAPAIVDHEQEHRVRAELLHLEQPDKSLLEFATVAEPGPAANTIFADCLACSSDYLDIFFGNVFAETNNSPLLGAAFRSIILKSLLQGCRTDTRHECNINSADIVQLAEAIDREALQKLRNLGLTMNLLYARFGKNSFDYFDCGRINILHYQAATGSYAVNKGGNPPLGLLEGTGFSSRSLPVSEGDILLVYLHTAVAGKAESGRHISDGRIAEIVQEFSEQQGEPPLSELSVKMAQNRQSAELEDCLACLALRVPKPAIQPESETESGLQEQTGRYQDA